MAFTFGCTACGKKLKAHESQAGKRCRCNGCGTINQIPAPTYQVSTPYDPNKIAFDCPVCSAKLSVPRGLAGTTVKCRCNSYVDVPVEAHLAEVDDLLSRPVKPRNEALTPALAPQPVVVQPSRVNTVAELTKYVSPEPPVGPVAPEIPIPRPKAPPVFSNAQSPSDSVSTPDSNFSFSCLRCGRGLKAQVTSAGKYCRCQCGEVQLIPEPPGSLPMAEFADPLEEDFAFDLSPSPTQKNSAPAEVGPNAEPAITVAFEGPVVSHFELPAELASEILSPPDNLLSGPNTRRQNQESFELVWGGVTIVLTLAGLGLFRFGMLGVFVSGLAFLSGVGVAIYSFSGGRRGMILGVIAAVLALAGMGLGLKSSGWLTASGPFSTPEWTPEERRA